MLLNFRYDGDVEVPMMRLLRCRAILGNAPACLLHSRGFFFTELRSLSR
jgi:hypothetical protein